MLRDYSLEDTRIRADSEIARTLAAERIWFREMSEPKVTSNSDILSLNFKELKSNNCLEGLFTRLDIRQNCVMAAFKLTKYRDLQFLSLYKPKLFGKAIFRGVF